MAVPNTNLRLKLYVIFVILVLIAGIVAAVLNLILPYDDIVKGGDDDNAEVIDVEANEREVDAEA